MNNRLFKCYHTWKSRYFIKFECVVNAVIKIYPWHYSRGTFSDKSFSLFRIILALYLDKTVQVSVCRNHSLRLFLVVLSACTLLSENGGLFCANLVLYLPSLCRTSFLLQDKHSMLFSSVTHTVMGTGRNMQIWRGRMATLRKLKRYAEVFRFLLVCTMYRTVWWNCGNTSVVFKMAAPQ